MEKVQMNIIDKAYVKPLSTILLSNYKHNVWK